jgi:hypothetical protein
MTAGPMSRGAGRSILRIGVLFSGVSAAETGVSRQDGDLRFPGGRLGNCEFRGLEGVPVPADSRCELLWRRSSITNGECVEVASREGHLLVRDSKAPDKAVLEFRRDDWQAFTSDIRRRNALGARGLSRAR